jgi:hypothetical protein
MTESHTSIRLGPICAGHLVVLILLVAGSSTAHAAEIQGAVRLAYLDPGTGSLIIQILVASLAATAVVTKTYWEKIKGWFGGASVADDGDPAPEARPETPPSDG